MIIIHIFGRLLDVIADDANDRHKIVVKSEEKLFYIPCNMKDFTRIYKERGVRKGESVAVAARFKKGELMFRDIWSVR